MNEIALFGGGGFIGSHLARSLAESNNELVIVDITDEKIPDLPAHESVEYREFDVSMPENDAKAERIVADSDIVVDLIAYANPQQYVDMPLDVVDLNYDQNMKIVEDCVKHDSRLIQFSTCEVYGKLGNRKGDDVVFNEDTSDLVMGPIKSHRWIYATAKQLLERVVHAYGLENELEWTIIRPFNFVGPEMDYIIESEDEGTPRVFGSFMSALLYNHPIYLVDGGTNRRSFTYIDDAVDAIELIIENPDGYFTNEIVNIGVPDNETSIEDFAYLMQDIYEDLVPGADLPEVKSVPGEEFYGEGYEDCERRVPDVQKLARAGWDPEFDLEDALETTMQYYLDNHDSAE